MFEYGEIVEVSQTKDFKESKQRIYLTYIQNANLPHICVDITQEAQFKTGDLFNYIPWSFARKFQSYVLNDPIIVWDEGKIIRSKDKRRHFARYGKNRIYTFPTGQDSWTFEKSNMELGWWYHWRKPTRKELTDIWMEKE